MRLSHHFTLAELTRTNTGQPNTPTTTHQAALSALCWQVMEPIRAAVGLPVRVTSGYRSAAVNRSVGGASSSQHSKGEAADIKVARLTAPELRDIIIAAGVPFDQLIWYDPERGGHVHVSYAIGRPQRGQVLHAPAAGGYR